jgi:hypothetical protein
VQERKALRRQFDLDAVAPDALRRGVEPESGDLEDGGAPPRLATGERAQARRQLGELERLDEVVVGAAVQARYAILDLRAP